jgi:hypothetical protein
MGRNPELMILDVGVIYKLSGAVAKLASINLRKLILSPTGLINLGFILREDLLLCSSYLPLGVPNWAVYMPSLHLVCFQRHDVIHGEPNDTHIA